MKTNHTHNVLVLLLILVLVMQSCLKEDHFGLSTYGNIKTIEVSNQASQAVINKENYTVDVEIPPGVDLSSIVINVLTLSSFAEANKAPGDMLPLDKPATIEIKAEDGTSYTWTINAVVANAEPQLQNSDFNLWYQTADGYYQPGGDASSTIWGTGNEGSYTLKILAVTPLEIEADNKAARMETMDNGTLAGAFGTPISAGSVFTGVFNKDKIDPTNPAAAIEFGTPFAARPTAFKIKYSYVPGAENKDKKGNLLDFGDMADVYAYLEVRSANQAERLATAWFRTGDEVNDLTELIVDFTYGKLDGSFPDYMKPKNGLYVSQDSASFVLSTHITFVASSSFDGDNFAGAIGSTLIIDDLEFIY